MNPLSSLLRKIRKTRPKSSLKSSPKSSPSGSGLILRLEKSLRQKISRPELFEEAFTHKGRRRGGRDNERLEFLGDAVLSLAITDALMRELPKATEGEMTKIRGSLVSGQSLAEAALDLGFDSLLKTARKKDRSNPRLLAGAFEAFLGAVYLDSGYPAAEKIILSLFRKKIKKKFFYSDYKSSLQEWSQRTYRQIPEYRLKKEEGPSHKRLFYVDALVDSQVLGSGSDRQKKQAEQNAAREALKNLKVPL